MSEPHSGGGTLPPSPSIEFLRKTAKDRLAAMRAGRPAARLAEAQLLVAREHGFRSWRAMAAAVATATATATATVEPDAAQMLRNERFRAAVIDGDLAAADRLLAADAALADATVFSFGSPAVNHVNGNLAMLDLLLSHGADLNRKSTWWAGGFGVLDTEDTVFADAAIARGATVDVFAAARHNKLALLQDLLTGDASLVHARGGDGGRPLHFARTVEAIDLLLERGADIDARDLDHESTAAQWRLPRPQGEAPRDLEAALACARHLVERGAATDVFLLAAIGDVRRLAELIDRDPAGLDTKVGAKDYPPCPDGPSRHIYLYALNEGRTAFEVARVFGQTACAEALLARSSPRQRFLAACAVGDRAAVTTLLRDRPAVLRDLPPADQAVLPNAAWTGNHDAVRLMLDLGFDPGTPAGTSATALHCAAWHGRADVVRTILTHPAVQDRRAELLGTTDARYKSTPLGWCCHGSTYCRNRQGDYPAVAALLLDAGSPVGPNAGDASDAVKAVLNR